jgi:small subunit ribosomal protein S6
MIIIDMDVDDAGIREALTKVGELITGEGGTVATTDEWGRRKFAYPINKKLEGYYVVLEIATEAFNLDSTDRYLRLADNVVRHKIMRLPDGEAARRGLLSAADA